MVVVQRCWETDQQSAGCSTRPVATFLPRGPNSGSGTQSASQRPDGAEPIWLPDRSEPVIVVEYSGVAKLIGVIDEGS